MKLLRLALAAVAALAAIATSPAFAADCVKEAEVCVEGPATRIISGHPVYRDCWRTTSSYSCLSARSNDDCQPPPTPPAAAVAALPPRFPPRCWR